MEHLLFGTCILIAERKSKRTGKNIQWLTKFLPHRPYNCLLTVITKASSMTKPNFWSPQEAQMSHGIEWVLEKVRILSEITAPTREYNYSILKEFLDRVKCVDHKGNFKKSMHVIYFLI